MLLINKIKKLLMIYTLRKRGIYISCNANVDSYCKFENINACNEIMSGVSLINCKIGRGTYIGCGSKFKNTNFGKFCSIGENIHLIYGNHPTHQYVSTHPCFYSKKIKCNINFNHHTNFEEYKVTSNGLYCEIGNDVWIGSDARILGGITIGNGAVIGAGSIVTKDVPPYAIIAGNPAKILRYRFQEEQIQYLEKIRWWDKDYEWMKQHINLFENIERFISTLK